MESHLKKAMSPKETTQRRNPDTDILRRYILYQTSWPPFKCQHDLKLSSCPTDINVYRQYETWRKKYIELNYNSNAERAITVSSRTGSQKGTSQRSSNTTASSRRNCESEDVTDEKNYMTEPGKWTPSRFLYSAKYGNLYQLNKNTRTGKGSSRKKSVWLWEAEYSEWLQKNTTKSDKKTNSKQLRTTAPSRKRTSRKKKTESYCPHADIYATYFERNLIKQRRKQAVTIVQKFVRGWFVRASIKRLIRKSNVKLNQSWPHLMQEYKDLLRRVKGRYDQPETSYNISLKDIEDYVDKKQIYHAAFDEVSCGEDKLSFDQLKTFFWKCKLYPTPGEIKRALKKVHRSCQNRIDLIILLENSNEIPEDLFMVSKTLCELLVGSMAEHPYQNRIGFATFTGNVQFHCRLQDKLRKVNILEKIGCVMPESGPSRISEALIAVQNTMRIHTRPWCQKACVLLTGGQALHRRRVHLESANLRHEGTDIYLIGIGEHVRTEDSQLVVKNSLYDFRLSAYDSIAELADLLLDMFANKSRNDSEDPRNLNVFSKVDIMEILWTIYPPKGTGLSEMKKSRWIRPIVEGDEAWSLLSEDIMKKTDLKACLRLVVSSTIEREGFIEVLYENPFAIKKVTDIETALEEIESYIRKKKRKDNKIWLPELSDYHT
ncbi:uncharacterized protein LOC115222736 isoform X1 [Octopus sinensis]|uniref:Uncharacterized protein LOC115222736 isoform X1 n=2 Tax=Octopus sinensis TaxID=2607531 RepID=A0A7E6FIY9_9MOLL|nr:uncharacterized protein LOC115222736 isoform X1 [Octopus sinensis]XP_036367701.1 uncharacterized protein LOC115222736 isoform X1 [Octopus sinensis]